MLEEFLGKVTKGDCLELMKQLPDKCIDLVLTDPPYGIGISSNPVRQKHEKMDWDNQTPSKEYFDEILRVSKNQIIWGGNYFGLPPSQCFIIWDKKQPEDFSLAMCEMAWTSFKSPAKIFRYSVQNEKNKQHPTQKPVDLFCWLINKYSKEGDIILDAFSGSGTTGVACIKTKRQFIGFELEQKYVDIANKRIQDESRKLTLF